MTPKIYTDAQGTWIETDTGLRIRYDVAEVNRRIRELGEEMILLLDYLKELGKHAK